MPASTSPSRSITAADLLPGYYHDVIAAPPLSASSSVRVTLNASSLVSAPRSRSATSQSRAASAPVTSKPSTSTSTSSSSSTTLRAKLSHDSSPKLPPRAALLSAQSPPRVVGASGATVVGSPSRDVGLAPVTTKGMDKGKGKAVDHDEPSVSLMRRLAGPSDQKAGLLRDPEEVKQVIYESSKGSKYFWQQEKKDAELTIKVNALVATLEQEVKARRGNLRAEEARVDEMIAEMEKSRVLTETIVVVDADAFYASCHQRQDPSLVGKAFGVGGGSGGGVLTTASYEARRYGCSSAMAGFVAQKLCPHLLFVKTDFALYTAASKEIFGILAKYGEISPASLDEAYCSLTDYCRREKCSPAVAAERMRAEILAETGLSVSAGVSPNAMLSKVGADRNKPNGQCVIDATREACMAFASSLRIRQVPGIGRVSERILHAVGIHTVADVYRERGKLFLIRNQIQLSFLLRAYLGLGSTEITQANRDNRKGISVERTFAGESDVKSFYARLRNIADALAEDCEQAEFSGRTLTLKIKFDNYDACSRASTLGSAIYFADATTLFNEGKRLLDKEMFEWKCDRAAGKKTKGGRVFALRLIGLRLSNLRDERAYKQSGGRLQAWANVQKKKKKTGPPKSKMEKRSKRDRSTASSDPTAAMKRGAKRVRTETGSGEAAGGDLTGSEDDLADESRDRTTSPSPEFASLIAPASSDPLWVSFDGYGADDSEAFLAEIDAMAAEFGQVDTTYKPFFTAGESLNVKKEEKREGPAPEKDRLRFAEKEVLVLSDSDEESIGGGDGGDDGDDDDNRAGASEKAKAPTQLTCPVCFKSFAGSEVALSAHVATHFKEGKNGRAPKHKGPSSSSTTPGLDRATGASSKRRGQATRVSDFWKR